MVALQVTETVPFGSFGNPYTCQIHAGASPAPLFRQFHVALDCPAPMLTMLSLVRNLVFL